MILALLWCLVGSAQASFEYLPAPTTFVTDKAGVLNSMEREKLEKRLAAFQASTGRQSVVLVVPSLQGDVLEDVAAEQFKRWGIGSKEKNNGLLLFIAVEDRAVRIEVGYGLEDRITDAVSSRIIRDEMLPLFRQQRFYDAILTYQIQVELILREGRDLRAKNYRFIPSRQFSVSCAGSECICYGEESACDVFMAIPGWAWLLIVVFLVLLAFVSRIFFGFGARNYSRYGTMNTGSNWGGGWGGGFGGGGFSGGGGTSGGGGASGRW